MAGQSKRKGGGEEGGRPVAQNRRARHDYAIEQTFEAGIVLSGTEVKSLRLGQASIGEAHAADHDGEVYLYNAHIPPYGSAKHFGHAPRAPRKLLLHKREIARIIGSVRRQGMTLVPLSIFFNARGIAKVSLGLARGKKKEDMRASIKEREWQREKARVLRDTNR